MLARVAVLREEIHAQVEAFLVLREALEAAQAHSAELAADLARLRREATRPL